jgi:hypothetical protein
MKRKFIALPALVAIACAVCAVAASSALAAPEWYSTAKAPEWQQGGAALTEASAVHWKGTVRVVDPAIEGAAIECESSGEGSVGPGATGKQTAWTFSNCKPLVAGTCTKLEKVKANGLPSSTELAYYGGGLHNVISGEKPGFQFTCILGGLNITTKCYGTTLETTASNVTGGVSAAFANKGVTCNFGGKLNSGEISGTQQIEPAKGAKLEVKEAAFTKLASSVAAKSSGTLTVEDQGYGGLAVACNVETGGTLEASGKGTITSYAATNCKPQAGCSTMNTVLAVHLPWHTELVEVGGAIHDAIVSGGSGTPEWRFECTGSFRLVDSCGINESPNALDGALGSVSVLFNEAEKVGCSLGGASKGAWRGELSVAPPTGAVALKVKP